MPTATRRRVKPASDKQMALIDNLIKDRVIDADAMPVVADEFGQYARDSKVASRFITFLFTMPRSQDAKLFTPDPGMYRMGDDLYRVKISRGGNWYAERAVKPGPDSTRKSLDWDYLGKRINLSDADALTDAEAGRFVGYCVRCNAELSVPESIARGMGPVCANKA